MGGGKAKGKGKVENEDEDLEAILERYQAEMQAVSFSCRFSSESTINRLGWLRS